MLKFKIAADLDEATLKDVFDDLKRKIISARRDGIQALWLTEAPWGNYFAETIIDWISVDEELHRYPILCILPVTAATWLAGEIVWIGDASGLFSTRLTIREIRKALRSLEYRPRLFEVVIKDPADLALSNAALDLVYEELAPEGNGWIYCEDPNETGSAICRHTATPWGARCSC